MHGKLGQLPTLTAVDRRMVTDNVGAAIATSRTLGARGPQIAAAARDAFVDSMSGALWIAAALAACAAIVALTQLPRRTATTEADVSHHRPHDPARHTSPSG